MEIAFSAQQQQQQQHWIMKVTEPELQTVYTMYTTLVRSLIRLTVHPSIHSWLGVYCGCLLLNRMKQIQPKLEYILTKIIFHRFVFDQQTNKKINVSTFSSSKNPFSPSNSQTFIHALISATSYSFIKFCEFLLSPRETLTMHIITMLSLPHPVCYVRGAWSLFFSSSRWQKPSRSLIFYPITCNIQ